MPDAADLAATLRTLRHHMRVDSPTPWRFGSSDRGVFDEGGWSIAWVDDSPEQPRFDPTTAAFIVWMANSAEAIATALERGAAAEAAIAEIRALGSDLYFVDALRDDPPVAAALAAYDALTDHQNMTWHEATMVFGIDHSDPACPTLDAIFEADLAISAATN